MELQDEDQKLRDVKRLLSGILAEFDATLKQLVTALCEVKQVEHLRQKESICRAIIDLGMLLQEFPLKKPYNESWKQIQNNDPRFLTFYNRMDKAMYTIQSKLDLIKDYLDSCTNFSYAVTLALVLRDVKQILLANEEIVPKNSPDEDIQRKLQDTDLEIDNRNIPPTSPPPRHSRPRKKKAEKLDFLAPPKNWKDTMKRNRALPLESLADLIQIEDQSNFAATDLVIRALVARKENLSGFEKHMGEQQPVDQETAKNPDDVALPQRWTSTPVSCIESIFDIGEDALTRVINDSNGLKLFRQFLEKEWGEENLLFVLDVDKYTALKTTDKAIHKQSQELFKTYIKSGAAMEINLTAGVKRAIVDSFAFHTENQDTFGAARREVLHLIKNDPFRRFLLSENYQLYLKSKLKE